MQYHLAGAPPRPPPPHPESAPAPPPPPFPPHYLYPNPHYSSPYPNPNPNLPAIDSYAASAAATPSHCYGDAASAQSYGGAYYVQSTVYTQISAVDATSGEVVYYPDPNAQNWTSPYAAAVATNETQQLVASQVKSISWKNAAKNKILKKQKNPVQHVWCDVCRIECTSKEILLSHRQGKKHQKNLEKLKATLAPAPLTPIGVPKNPIIGPQENSKKRKPKEEEDLETKKKKVVAGGAALHAVKTCEICNVVCNSDLVFKFHLAGQKHVAMMKKVRP